MKRLLLLASILAILILGGALFLWFTDPSRRISLENFERVGHCATRQEVIGILGEPHYRPGEFKDFSYGGTLASMILEQEGEVWRAGELTLYVRFTTDGKVSGTMSRVSSFHRRESFVERLRRWLGL